MNDAPQSFSKGFEQSEERFRLLVETGSDWIWEVDAAGTYIYSSPHVEKILGYKPEEMLGKTPFDFMPESEKERLRSRFHELCRFKQSIKGLVNINLHKDGHEVILETDGMPIFDENGNLTGYRGADRDITERKRTEELLRQKEAELAGIFRAVPVGIGLVKDRVLLKVNDRVCQMTGYSHKELEGRNALVLYPTEEDYNYVGKEKYRQLESKDIGVVETRWRKKDGSIIDILLRSTFFDLGDHEKGLIFTALDITERKFSEKKLADSEQRFRSIINSSPMGIHLWELQPDGRLILLSSNPAAEEILGISLKELEGKPIEKAFPGLVETDVPEAYRKLCREGGTFSKDNFNYSDARFSGSYSFFAFQTSPGRMAVMYTDIRERLEADQQLRMLQFAIEHAGEALYWIGADAGFLYVNKAACTNLGYSCDELLKMKVFDIDPFYDPEKWPAHWQKTKSLGVTRFESRHRKKDGTIIPVEITVNFLEFGDKEFHFAFVRDISERKAGEAVRETLLQELKSKNEELENIVFIASHDLRSPLVNIEGFTGEVRRSCTELKSLLEKVEISPDVRKQIEFYLSEDIPESIRFISKGTAKMDTLLSGLLRLSRIGTASIRIEPINMNLLMRTVLGTMSYQVRELGVDVQLQDLPICLGDAVQIHQVFSNLIDNAIKYRHPERPARIRISGKTEENRAIYAVEDNGIGIDPSHQEKIFDIFNQLNPWAGDRGEGLGLTIVRRILERQNGSVRVESKPGAGSVFYVTLPKPHNNSVF